MERQTFHLHIVLKGTKPPIWERVAVASEITLGQLHEVIKTVMGWTDKRPSRQLLTEACWHRTLIDGPW